MMPEDSNNECFNSERLLNFDFDFLVLLRSITILCEANNLSDFVRLYSSLRGKSVVRKGN